jgi:hypothetical protein
MKAQENQNSMEYITCCSEVIMLIYWLNRKNKPKTCTRTLLHVSMEVCREADTDKSKYMQDEIILYTCFIMF